ncbi:MAG TPA: hypothetical protein VFS42_12210 [Burkholderiaceae bacterium]|nr:hypothetical protein [Burkholderiaceae bacterium]
MKRLTLLAVLLVGAMSAAQAKLPPPTDEQKAKAEEAKAKAAEAAKKDGELLAAYQDKVVARYKGQGDTPKTAKPATPAATKK